MVASHANALQDEKRLDESPFEELLKSEIKAVVVVGDRGYKIPCFVMLTASFDEEGELNAQRSLFRLAWNAALQPVEGIGKFVLSHVV